MRYKQNKSFFNIISSIFCYLIQHFLYLPLVINLSLIAKILTRNFFLRYFRFQKYLPAIYQHLFTSKRKTIVMYVFCSHPSFDKFCIIALNAPNYLRQPLYICMLLSHLSASVFCYQLSLVFMF